MEGASEHVSISGLAKQIWGKSKWLWLCLVICLLIHFFASKNSWEVWKLQENPWQGVLFISILLVLFILICSGLTDYFRIRKKENAITWSQISILFFIGLWIAGIIWIFDLTNSNDNKNDGIILGIAGVLLTWIFQDKVKGVLTFIHLRFHHLLDIDDWIIVPNHKIDGVVKRVSLTTVTVYNWDTTTSTFPISSLHSEQFTNLQKMTTGRTFGRQMTKSFIFDTGLIRPLTSEEAKQLMQRESLTRYLPEEEIREGVLNAQLFRLYLYHWLMNHPKISQQPRLVVRWLEQKESGLPLAIYAYIMEGSLAAFEWEQSQIIEHVVESLDWFGLRLYQAPSSFEIKDSVIQLNDKGAPSRKEDLK